MLPPERRCLPAEGDFRMAVRPVPPATALRLCRSRVAGRWLSPSISSAAVARFATAERSDIQSYMGWLFSKGKKPRSICRKLGARAGRLYRCEHHEGCIEGNRKSSGGESPLCLAHRLGGHTPSRGAV